MRYFRPFGDVIVSSDTTVASSGNPGRPAVAPSPSSSDSLSSVHGRGSSASAAGMGRTSGFQYEFGDRVNFPNDGHERPEIIRAGSATRGVLVVKEQRSFDLHRDRRIIEVVPKAREIPWVGREERLEGLARGFELCEMATAHRWCPGQLDGHADQR